MATANSISKRTARKSGSSKRATKGKATKRPTKARGGKALPASVPSTRPNEPPYNTLAWKLTDRHSATLDELNDLIGGIVEISEPTGHFGPWDKRRRATNKEAGLASLTFWHKDLDVDLRGDIPAQIVERMLDYAREIKAAAADVKRAAKRGKFTKIVKGHYVTQNDDDVFGPGTYEEARQFAMKADGGGKVVRRLTDDRQLELHDWEEAKAAKAAGAKGGAS